MKPSTLIIYLLVIVMSVSNMLGQKGTEPNRTLTPGDVANVTVATMCSKGYSARARHVTASTKHRIRLAYRVGEHDRNLFVIDHLIPLQLGGSNHVSNLWPQVRTGTFWSSYKKDRLGSLLKRKVCSGRMSPIVARNLMRFDWKNSYKAFFPNDKFPD
jgi:hypothetical protein